MTKTKLSHVTCRMERSTRDPLLGQIPCRTDLNLVVEEVGGGGDGDEERDRGRAEAVPAVAHDDGAAITLGCGLALGIATASKGRG
jgi:hypothetical protein